MSSDDPHMFKAALPVLAPVTPSVARALDIPRVLSGVQGVALTFDDGPHPEGTPAVLEVLARMGACATFFLVGEQVQQRPALAREIVAAGHTVALHGYRHRLQLKLGVADVATDIERGLGAIGEATGLKPGWHRPPYGVYSSGGLRAARALGLQPLLWSRVGKDWRRFTSPARIATRATQNIVQGDVILLHDADFYSSRNSYRQTVKALPLIIAELQRRGLKTVQPD
jgi:peptidoglycan-N-acetylglucosamine deacetylase